MHRLNIGADGNATIDRSPVSVIETAIWEHPAPVRKPNPAGYGAEPAFVWRCTGADCDWLHERASDGGGEHFRHQAERIAAALCDAGHLAESR